MAKSETPMSMVCNGAIQIDEFCEKVKDLPEQYRAIAARILRAKADELSPMDPIDSTAASLEETAIQRIANFFRDRGNTPATLVEMSGATGVPYTSVRNFVYKRHRDKFVKKPVPSGKSMLWKWAEFVDLERAGV
jgi:hypothetical protein